jgi:hypothetical protein
LFRENRERESVFAASQGRVYGQRFREAGGFPYGLRSAVDVPASGVAGAASDVAVRELSFKEFVLMTEGKRCIRALFGASGTYPPRVLP